MAGHGLRRAVDIDEQGGAAQQIGADAHLDLGTVTMHADGMLGGDAPERTRGGEVLDGLKEELSVHMDAQRCRSGTRGWSLAPRLPRAPTSLTTQQSTRAARQGRKTTTLKSSLLLWSSLVEASITTVSKPKRSVSVTTTTLSALGCSLAKVVSTMKSS